MVDYNFIPGKPKIADIVGGSPYSPDGPAFANDWLNPILKQTAAHWTVLSNNYTATVDDHGKWYKLAGYTMTLDPVADLNTGWRVHVQGPGIITPETGEGDSVTLISTQWAIVTHDGTSVIVLISSAGSQEPLATAVQLAGGIEEGTYPAALRYHTVSSFTHLHGEIITGTGSVIVYVHVNGLPVAGPFEIESGSPIDETIDVGLEIADYVDWIIEDPTGLVEYLYLQMDGSS
jgi:hypothetical protein